MKEHLARFHTKDGKTVDMHREDGDIVISSKDHRAIIPQATGQQTLDLISLFEGLVERIEYPEEAGVDK